MKDFQRELLYVLATVALVVLFLLVGEVIRTVSGRNTDMVVGFWIGWVTCQRHGKGRYENW